VGVGGGFDEGVDVDVAVAAGGGFGAGVDVAAGGGFDVGCAFGVGCGLDCATALGGVATSAYAASIAVATITPTRPRVQMCVACFPRVGTPTASSVSHVDPEGCLTELIVGFSLKPLR
jgi:hypothetical protein